MQPLRACDLVKIYGDRRVLDGVDLLASPGQRVGLVGENGAGKSTLLRLLAGVEQPDAGEVTRPADIGFGHQELPFPGAATVRTVLDDALVDVHRALRRLEELAPRLDGDQRALTEYGEVLDWAQAHDAWDAGRRAAVVLAGLGLSAVGTARRLDTLSGGQRTRLALAALLIRRPAALLLDEPTNHLDDEAVGFVESHLRTLPYSDYSDYSGADDSGGFAYYENCSAARAAGAAPLCAGDPGYSSDLDRDDDGVACES